jgi:hypothetical protein
MINWNNPEEVKQYHKEWSINNIKKRRIYDKNWKINNPTRLKENSKKYELKRKERCINDLEYKLQRSEQNKKRYENKKMEVLKYYSNNLMECNCCKENNPTFLTIDHINGNGFQHKKIVIYYYLYKNNYPSGYQVLCYNCNSSKKNSKKCYHMKSLQKIQLTHTQKCYKKLKTKVMKYYSDKYNYYCSCCGENEINFLTIDHINGGGTQHRKKIGISSYEFYKWIVKNNYPKEFQVLCYNCNCAKGKNSHCPHKLLRKIVHEQKDKEDY